MRLLHWLCFHTVTKTVVPDFDPETGVYSDGKLAMGPMIMVDAEGNCRSANMTTPIVTHTTTTVRQWFWPFYCWWWNRTKKARRPA